MNDDAQRALPLNILVVDDEVNIRKTLSVCLETEGHKAIAVSNFQDALTEASRKSFELAFVDLRLGTQNGLDLIPALLGASPWMKIVVITAYASIDTAVEAMRRGCYRLSSKAFHSRPGHAGCSQSIGDANAGAEANGPAGGPWKVTS